VRSSLGRNGIGLGTRGWNRPRPRGNGSSARGTAAPRLAFSKLGEFTAKRSALPGGSDYPYRQVGRWDAWVDDLENPYDNRHYIAKPGKVPAWFESQRMRLGDAAYEFRIEVRHNADPPVPGYGSAIFFHIRRGEDRPSSGCTVMSTG